MRARCYYYLPRSSRKHGDHGAPHLSSKIMPKHDEDMGGTGEKNIGGQLGLVRIYSTQRPIKTHDIHYKTYLFEVSVPISSL